MRLDVEYLIDLKIKKEIQFFNNAFFVIHTIVKIILTAFFGTYSIYFALKC